MQPSGHRSRDKPASCTGKQFEERRNDHYKVAMKLDSIIHDSGCVITSGNGGIEISAICCDSRKVIHGSLFVAVKGFASDGHDYISAAIGKGAVAVVYEDQESAERQMDASGKEGIVMIKAESAR